MNLRKITSANVKEKNVLVRVDYNVPLKNGLVLSTERIEASLKTINFLLQNEAAVVLCSHLGRPEGKKNADFSLEPVAKKLGELLSKPVKFIPDCIGEERNKKLKELKLGEIVLLENLRFYAEEENNDPEFAAKLAEECDIYVNDAFSASHRAHASIVEVADLLPAYAGFNLLSEVEHLLPLRDAAKKPFVMISGGAKVSDKIDLLKGVISKVDVLMIGGGMANTFLAAEGYEVGKSLYEPDYLDNAEEISRSAEESGVELMLPDDVVVAKNLNEDAQGITKSIDEVEKSDIIVDVGNRSIAKWAEPLKFAGTIFWNGPIGINENREFAKGTIALAKIVAESQAEAIIGGGDTISAVTALDLKFDFVSTGGGATLELVAGENLPGLEVLKA